MQVGMESPATALWADDSYRQVAAWWDYAPRQKPCRPARLLFLQIVAKGQLKMLKWFLIAGGGAAGSMLRHAMQGWVHRIAGDGFPFGTLVVNVSACFAIGVLSAFFAGPQLIREEYRIGLTVGILGGYSTFSTFGLESFNLANEGEFTLAALNMMLSCGVGLAAVWIGYRLAQHWFGV
jgi:fluoride exporter